MALSSYITPQDVVDAIGETTYMALFDEGLTPTNSRTTVDASNGVQSTIRRAHSQVLSRLPRVYTTMPPEAAGGINATDSIPVLLKDAEIQYAVIYAYRRHPEYVRTYGAEPGGLLIKEADALMERLATSVQEIAPTDNPPEPKPRTARLLVTDNARRIIIDSADGTFNGGDF